MPSTWRQYSRRLIRRQQAIRRESEYVARSYLSDIRANLQKRGLAGDRLLYRGFLARRDQLDTND